MGENKIDLTTEEIEKAKIEKEKFEKKALYWHTAIPTFDHNLRSSFTKDVNLVFTYEQLELNKSLSSGIKLNNWINIIFGVVNLFLFIFYIISIVITSV